jgi:hypothetical protein
MNPDADPAFQVNPDPVFDDQKLRKEKLQLEKIKPSAFKKEYPALQSGSGSGSLILVSINTKS